MMKASLLDHLDRLADESPSKLLYSFLDLNGDSTESYTYASFQHRTRAIAAHLRKDSRFAPGERLLLAYPPGLEILSTRSPRHRLLLSRTSVRYPFA